MNPSSKRFRQTSIFESFAFTKKPKANTMEEDAENKELSTDDTSNIYRVPSLECLSDLPTSENNICQAANDSTNFKIGNDTVDEKDIEEIPTSSIIDKLWTSNDDTYKYSADLFPEGSSLEEYSVPSSSQSTELLDSQKELFGSESTPEDEEEDTSEYEEMDDITFLNRNPQCSIPLPTLEPLENHSIMFSPHIRPGDAPRPYPRSYVDKWDVDHVRMPCSPLNRYPIINNAGEKYIGSRWDLICRSLRSDIGSSKELERAIMRYNTQYADRWNFQGLHAFINQHWSEEERDHFFEVLLPAMVEMALSLPTICTQPVPLLKRNEDHFITMSQKQVGCLLLNAFFCTFPRRTLPARHKKNRWNFEYATYPDINFDRLFFGVKNDVPRRNAEKFKCLFNYFRRIVTEEPTGTITFHRQVIRDRDFPIWHTSTRGIRTAVVKSQGLIETDGHGMLQVDFANKYLGGGVLGQGLVQEEIRFLICPELIISRLFIECLEKNEAVIITGAEQFNNYSGYCDTFTWEGDFRDNTPTDSWGRRCTQVVAIDAINFKVRMEQFKICSFKRELNKAYSGFYEDGSPNHLSAVATGNWGCGAFKGNPNLKFVLQLMAASEAGRSLLYFTFGNKKLKTELENFYEFLNDKNLSVGDIWRLLVNYSDVVDNSDKHIDLFHFIYSQFVTKKSKVQQGDANSNELTDSDKKAAEMIFEDVAYNDSLTDIQIST